MASNVHWHDTEGSEDESHHDLQAGIRKRSSRACDQCRKTKSKCERLSLDAEQCKSCASAGISCTYLGPSYKRGPPKGYIHAIEQRWHQVESLLGAILASPDPRAQSLISDLRLDDFAREILARVDAGPFGPSGRINQPAGATKEDFFASILRGAHEGSAARDAARSRRQSRVSREIVSSTQDSALLAVPTMEWQDRLSSRLATSSHFPPIPGVNPNGSLTKNILPSNPAMFDLTGAPLTQRRRLNLPTGVDALMMQPDWNSMYTMESDDEDPDTSEETAEGVGQLSLDENKEVRYHGKASGLHLLGKSDRIDDRHEGGIWRLPMARVWPLAKNRVTHFLQEDDMVVTLPPISVQDHLIELYFTHVHPVFPVIHKAHFLKEYHESLLESMMNTPSPPPDQPQASQTVSKLLLLAMFSVSARFTEQPSPPPPSGKMWEVGCDYLEAARDILTRVFHRSRASTCQALLLLGHREFGIGSMEQGWVYIGMAIRMAQDLGLNRNADKWQAEGHCLFTAEEKQVRKQIWWSCCIADEYGSVYMGRPVAINESNYDSPLPDMNSTEENESWQPLPYDAIKISYPAVPGRIMSCFRAGGQLSVIVGSIVTLMYPVRPLVHLSRRQMLASLENRLDRWYIELPESLRYDTTSKRITPPPHILFLHIRYWGAVLLLHRAFIPNWKENELSRTPESEASLKAFDLCQGAASHIASIVTAYNETFGMTFSPAFLTAYLLHAGIMHVVTLALRPQNLQASLGLQQIRTVLKEMEVVWPSAARAWDLLSGVKVRAEGPSTSLVHGPERNKRDADDAFGQEKSSDYLQRAAFGGQEEPEIGTPGVQDLSTRIMAHMLGLDVPGIEASTSYYPGYEWWPRQDLVSPVQAPSPQTASSLNASTPSEDMNLGGVAFDGQSGIDEWLHGSTPSIPAGYAYDIAGMQAQYGF